MNVRLRMAALAVAFVAAVGCNKKDLNKDLKPVDPNAPPPKMVKESQGGGKKAGTGDGPPPVVK